MPSEFLVPAVGAAVQRTQRTKRTERTLSPSGFRSPPSCSFVPLRGFPSGFYLRQSVSSALPFPAPSTSSGSSASAFPHVLYGTFAFFFVPFVSFVVPSSFASSVSISENQWFTFLPVFPDTPGGPFFGGLKTEKCHSCHSGEWRSRKEDMPLGRVAFPEGKHANRHGGHL